MADPYFLVSKYPDENKPTDIAFTPVNKKTIPKEYLRFKADVEAFIATINVLFSKDKDTQSQFYDEAYYAAELCFSGDKSDLLTATQTLDEVKDKLTSSYWAKVRDGILAKYGSAVFLFSLPFVLGFYVLSESYKFYFISLIGTCVGSWLSLAIRTKQLVFDDIRQHLSEVTSPYIRCIFACVLSFVFLMLLKVGFVEIKLGTISSKDISTNLEVALTLGILLGFGEKYLISSINNKSQRIFKWK